MAEIFKLRFLKNQAKGKLTKISLIHQTPLIVIKCSKFSYIQINLQST
jgi:hypothetical protein